MDLDLYVAGEDEEEHRVLLTRFHGFCGTDRNIEDSGSKVWFLIQGFLEEYALTDDSDGIICVSWNGEDFLDELTGCFE